MTDMPQGDNSFAPCGLCGRDVPAHVANGGKCPPRLLASKNQTFTDQFDEWIGVTGALEPDTGWHIECRSILEDADKEIERLSAGLADIRSCAVLTDCGIDPMRAAGQRQAFEITAEIAAKTLEGKPDDQNGNGDGGCLPSVVGAHRLDLSKVRYTMSEPHLSGYRLILGFETLADCQAAQAALIHEPGPNV